MKQGHTSVLSHIIFIHIFIINKKSQRSISSYIKSMSILIAKHTGGEEPSIFWILISGTSYKGGSYKGKKYDVLRLRRTK